MYETVHIVFFLFFFNWKKDVIIIKSKVSQIIPILVLDKDTNALNIRICNNQNVNLHNHPFSLINYSKKNKKTKKKPERQP